MFIIAFLILIPFLIIPILVIAHNNGPFWVGRATWQDNPTQPDSFLR